MIIGMTNYAVILSFYFFCINFYLNKQQNVRTFLIFL